MKKKVFAILYAAVTAVLLAAGISTAVRNNRKWPVSADDYEAIMEGGLSLRDEVKEAAGAVNRILQPTVYYADGDAIVRTDNDYLLTFHAVSGFDMDLAIDRITALKEFCDGYGIPLFYVSFPSKATYTELNPADYGIYSNEKETRELFLERIRETGIPLLDMAGVFKERGFSQEDVFYRTDHHWKTRMGLIAAKETAEFMKKGITQDIHTELLEEERFHTTAYEYQWLGETGRKVSAAWAGTLDDYVLYEPDYETSFEYYVPASRISTEGDFSAFIDHNLLSREPDLYQDSLHYIYI